MSKIIGIRLFTKNTGEKDIKEDIKSSESWRMI
jgi:hypothetical protein